MNEEMKSAFRRLDINDKRNQLSNELLIMYELIKKFEIERGVNPITQVKNYNSINDRKLSEDEMLEFLYEDVYNLQQELITLLNIVSKWLSITFV